MKRLAHILLDGKREWVEIVEKDIFLMHGIPTDVNFRRNKKIKKNLDNLDFLAPTFPKKVIGVGWNYKDLVGEKESYDEPLIFLKSPQSICPTFSEIPFPTSSSKVWVEVELVIVIGSKCSNASLEQAKESILGYTLGSDVTALNILKRDWHLARSKAFDNFAPIGPYLLQEIDTNKLSLKSFINNQEAQSGNTKDMILKVDELISLISSVMTLEPWDVIFTGTPARAREAIVKPGDFVRHSIEYFGELNFKII